MGTYAQIRKKTEKIVKAAARLAQGVDFQVTVKDDVTNLVTSSDISVQRYLCAALKKLLPQAGFYCEEENRKDEQSEYIWVIDPIDGTANYARGVPECAISVGLLHEQRPVVGVVYNPFRKALYSAAEGDGATKNGKPIRVSDRSFSNALLFTAMSLYKKELAAACNAVLCEAYDKCNDFRRFGSCATELCYLAEGKGELYFEMRVFPWDYAGASVIVKEAGGVLKGYDGAELTFTRPTLLVGANNAENYAQLNEIVLKHVKELPYEK